MAARYQVIRDALEARIRSGELAVGARLPSEAELQAEYGVSRATAQKALNELAQAGLVVRRRGRAGTLVSETGSLRVDLLRFIDPQDSGGDSLPGTHAMLSAEVIPAVDAEVDLPGLDDDTPVTQVVRLKYDIDEKPVTMEVSAVPFALVPRLLQDDLVHKTIRAVFMMHDVKVTRSRMYLDPVLASKQYAELLGIEPGSPIHRRRRFMWLSNGDLAESAAYYSPPERFELYLEYSVPSD